MIVVMVRIPVGSAEEGEKIAERFRNRLGAVDNQQGFLGFELLKGEGEYISVTRWENQEALDGWMHSSAHGQAHGQPQGAARPQAAQTGGHPTGDGPAPARNTASSTLTYEVVIPESSK